MHIVLIHSPLVGPTTWAALAREIEQRGRPVVVPSLVGVADAPAPQWRRAPQAVRDATSHISDSVVLVGHSGAGPLLPVISEAVTAEVAALIFVDAFLPPPRGSTTLMPPQLLDRLRPLARDGRLPPWSRWFGDETIRELVPDESVRRSLEQEMPQLPLSYFEGSVPMPEGWRRRRCAYLLLSPVSYGESAARARAAGWPVADIPDGHHLSIVTNAVAVADALVGLERQLLAQA